MNLKYILYIYAKVIKCFNFKREIINAYLSLKYTSVIYEIEEATLKQCSNIL